MQNSKLDTNSILADIKNELCELWKSYNKLEPQIVMLEQKSWNNEQYSTRECLEISGLSSNTEDSQLEGTVL